MIKSKGISRNRAKLLLEKSANYLLYLVTCCLIATGAILAFRLPHGPIGRGKSILGWDRHEWGDLHLWFSYLFIFLILLHLYLVRKWIINVAAKKSGRVLLLSLGLGLAIVVVSFLLPVQQGLAQRDRGSEFIKEKHNANQREASGKGIGWRRDF